MKPYVWGFVALICVGCQSKAEPGRPVATVSASASPSASPSAVAVPDPMPEMQAIVDDALRGRDQPTAAVVLGFGQKRVLALGAHQGADPKTLTARPGSTMKPLTAWIAARSGKQTAAHSVTCSGKYAPIAGLHCYATHGELSLAEAIEVSCNSYFFDAGRRLGWQGVRAGFEELGFGKPTGLAPGEARGLLPSDEWLENNPEAGISKEQRLERLAAMVAGGHGPFEVTPLQLASAYYELAKGLSAPRGKLESEIFEGMTRVVQGTKGTGKRAAIDGLRLAGKTGSAESTPWGADDKGAPENGWFVAFAPADKPEILVLVLAVRGGTGGAAAAPVAKRIFSDWRAKKKR